MEIFGKGGQLYRPIAGNNALSLSSQGAAILFQSLKVNKLKSIWPAAGR